MDRADALDFEETSTRVSAWNVGPRYMYAANPIRMPSPNPMANGFQIEKVKRTTSIVRPPVVDAKCSSGAKSTSGLGRCSAVTAYLGET
ncbi:MAG: hypothetical protein R3B90_17290, partial [Planctomycetaceae bacterium]